MTPKTEEEEDKCEKVDEEEEGEDKKSLDYDNLEDLNKRYDIIKHHSEDLFNSQFGCRRLKGSNLLQTEQKTL